MKAILLLKIQEEADLKKAGNKNYKEISAQNYNVSFKSSQSALNVYEHKGRSKF